MSKLAPSNPSKVMVVRQVTPNISTLSVPFARFGKVQIGGRATLVRLQSGSVAVFSPVALTDEVKSHVSSLGTVRYLIAPDFEHHIFLGPWHKEYPDAKVLVVEGLPEKRQKQGSDHLRFDVVFTAAECGKTRVDTEFDSEFEYEYLPSHPNKELAFLAKRERTLVEADLMFNLPATEQYSRAGGMDKGLITRLFSFLQNTTPQGAKWQQRFIWYAMGSKDRPAFNASVARIAGWDFDRIVPCHGDVIEGNGNEVFKRVFGWHIDAAQHAKKE